MNNLSKATKEVEERKVNREVTLRKTETRIKANLLINALLAKQWVSSKDLKSTITEVLGIFDRHTINAWVNYLRYKQVLVEKDEGFLILPT